MSFFKKLFSKNKPAQEQEETSSESPNIQAIYTTDYFKERYVEENMYSNPTMLDGCIKMVLSYFLDNKIDKKIDDPINHPINLDQVVDDGFGFALYCKGFQFGDSETTLFLAYAFSDFLIKKYGFKLYKDNQPEFPLRTLTLKYDQNGVVLSIYPFEYALKVLNYEATFENLYNKIETNIGKMPGINEIVDKYINPKEEE